MLASDWVFRRNKRGRAGDLKLIGRTDGGRCITIIVARTWDEGTWAVVTGWESTTQERGCLG